ncbi:MAG: hypothetical protein ACU0A4_09515 [Paracoccaceae bacterium]
MRLVWFLAFSILLSTSVDAQTAVLRSGEHSDFTRLTLRLPSGTEWSADLVGRQLSISLDGDLRAIDIASVYRRIGRERIANIAFRPGVTALEITLACDCGIRAYVQDGSLLVVDVGEGLPKQDRVLSAGYESLTSWKDGSGLAFLGLPYSRHSRNHPLYPTFQPRQPSLLSAMVDGQAVALEEESETTAQGVQPDFPEVGSFEERLLSEMGRALDQGLLIPADSSLQQRKDEQDKSPSLQPFNNMRLRLATEANYFVRSENSLGEGKVSCPPEEYFDLPKWGAPDGFAPGLSRWRQMLTLEFDKVNEDAALGLARHYLHYGFGQEALDTLALSSRDDPEVEVLSSLARIMDLGHDPLKGPTPQFADCVGPASLWALLSTAEPNRSVQLDLAAIRLAFEALPRHLREHLGPFLIDRLVALNEDEAAREITSALSVLTKNIAPEMSFAEARAAANVGDTDGAKGTLEELVEVDTAVSPAALVALIDAMVSADEAVSDSHVELLASFAFENRRSAMSNELTRAYILALAHSGQFSEAIDRLNLFSETTLDPGGLDTKALVLKRLLNHSTDVAFITESIEPPESDLPAWLGNGIASRLISLGFPDGAARYLTATADGEEGRERRILRAKSALAVFEPDSAEAELLGLSGEDVDVLRLEAGRLRRESPLGSAVAKEPREGVQFDLADTALDDGLQQGLAVKLSTDGEATDPIGLLGQAQTIISESEEARSALRESLNRYQVDDRLAP